MSDTTLPLRELPAWEQLEAHHAEVGDVHLRELFASDPDRGARLTAEGAGLFLDYSKHRVTDETLRLLLELAAQRGLRERIDAMFAGEKINTTEGRAVLHVALRAPRDAVIEVDGENVVPDGARGARPDGGVRGPRARRASGSATPASRSATWSTSASAAPTSGR